MLNDSKSLKAAISALDKLKKVDYITLSDARNDYGDCWSAIFDELREHRVVSSPDSEKRIHVNKNYIFPTRLYYQTQLKDKRRISLALTLSIISLIISSIDLAVKLLLK